MEEIWKDIKDFEGLYQISNFGRVKSLERRVMRGDGTRLVRERILKLEINDGNYHIARLYKNRNGKTLKIHQLVAIAFLNHEPCGMKLVVNHINFDKQNNNVDNLEIITQRENSNQKHLKSSSKYTGVCWNKQAKKWRAQIKINGKKKHLGSFTDEYEAHLAYETALAQIPKGK